MTDQNRILVDSIKRLLRRGASSHLLKILDKTHAADISIVFRSLTLPEQRKLLAMIKDPEQKGALYAELEEDIFLNLIQGMDPGEIARVLENMPPDDAADLIGRMPETLSSLILDRMQKKESAELEGLLRYPDDTAGGIMIPDFIALRKDTTAREAIESIQKDYHDVEMPFYLYVVDDYNHLVGVSSLRQLVVHPPATPLSSLMTTDVFSVHTNTDQEEVAKIVARYDILAVPVVDSNNKLLGIVTVDDVIDIFRREATEDILKMAGAGGEFIETKSIIKSTRIRLPWLFASCLGGIFAFFVIGHFEGSLQRYTFLAAFIPVIMGMGGNIGTQSSTIVVRGLATGRIELQEIWAVIFKELSIGFILGVVYGSLLGIVAHLRYGIMPLGLSVGLAVVCSMSIAALVGSMVPMVFARVHIDPAVATGPFVTTAIDIISVFFYFQIATVLLGI